MIEITYDDGKAIVDNFDCECGTGLVLCWGGKWGINGYVVRCANDEGHTEMRERLSVTQAWKRGHALPLYIESHLRGKHYPKSSE